MEVIAVIVVIGIAFLLLSGYFKTHIQNPESIPDADLEESYIELKKLILTTSAYEAQSKYERLYDRVTALLAKVLDRHRHFVLDVESRKERLSLWDLFLPEEHHTSEGLAYTTHAVPRNIIGRNFDSEVFLYLCFFLYLGGSVKGVGKINQDVETMIKILDFLIAERDYMPARFFKGLVLKYGLKPYHVPRATEARPLLEAAAQNGVGAATLELRGLEKMRSLENIKSVHILP